MLRKTAKIPVFGHFLTENRPEKNFEKILIENGHFLTRNSCGDRLN